MNQVNETSKNRLLRVFAVFGFLAIIIIATWLAVQVVRLIPDAFSSLASLAENVEEGRESQNDIVLETTDGVTNASEAFALSWSEVKRPGSYSFEYDCADGVAANLRINGAIASVDCGSPFELPEDTYAMDVLFTSEKNRFTDVTYRIAFTKANEEETFVSAEHITTVVNASIPVGVVMGDADAEEAEEPEETEEEVEETPATPTPSTPNDPIVGYRYEVTYKEPVSDPNGYTDLGVRLLAVGTIDDGDFVDEGEFEVHEVGAIQFEVRNLGTKTSTGWNFEVELPNGEDFKSESNQAPLKPNERAYLTVVFMVPDDEGETEFTVSISGGSDTKNNNNEFTAEVEIAD